MATTHAATVLNSEAEFKALVDSTKYVVIDFWAEWCPPCKAIAPAYQNLASKHSIPGTLTFAKLDVDNVPAVAASYNITAIPTFLFLEDGKPLAITDEGAPVVKSANPRALTAAAEKIAALAKGAN
jgi:thioredoxin 1